MTDLEGQSVVVLGGSTGIGLEAARLARARGASLILTTRNPDGLYEAGKELDAMIAVVDLTDFARLEEFFELLPGPVDHILLTGASPCCAPLRTLGVDEARRVLDTHLVLPLVVARSMVRRVRPGGTLLFVGATGGRRVKPGLVLIGAITAALPALTRNLALELAPIRVNLIATKLVDVPASAGNLTGLFDARGEQFRGMPPARRIVEPGDVAALAVQLMTNTAITGATFDVDGGQ